MKLSDFKNASMSKLSKIPKESISANVIVMKVVSPGENSGGPTNLRVVFLSNVKIPYFFKLPKPESKNLIRTADPNATFLEKDALDKTTYVTIFNLKDAPIAGGIYRLDGCLYDFYKGLTDEDARPSVSATRITAIDVGCIGDLMKCVPFENRSIHLDRDIPGVDRTLYLSDVKKNDYCFFYVKVGEGYPDEVDTILGYFTPPEPGEQLVTMYTPQPKKGVVQNPIIAMTGGRMLVGTNDMVVDNKFILKQIGSDVLTASYIMGQTKLYADSLDRFQVDWNKFARTLMPVMNGDAFCTINREKTKDLDVLDERFVGAVSLSVKFHPDLALMIRKVGFPIDWTSAQELDARLLKPDEIVSNPKTNMDTIVWSNAINILAISGDVSAVCEGYACGWIELFALTNRPFTATKRQELQAKDCQTIVKELLDDGEYHNGSRATAIFAICSKECPIPLIDFFSANGTPKAFSSFTQKKMKEDTNQSS